MPHDNNAVIDKAVDRFAQNTIIPKAIEGFEETAENILSWIESNTGDALNYDQDIPIVYGNLRDSIGLAIYAQGKFIDFKPSPIAQMPSEYKDEDIWGADLLAHVIEQAASKYDDDNVYLVAFAAAPYAENVDSDFWEVGVIQEIVSQAFPNLKTEIEA